MEAPCVSCGFPVSGSPGQKVACPMCGTAGVITQGAEVPWKYVLFALLGTGVGYWMGRN
jgi:hypothetical protein